MEKIRKILVANRGEIAIRILRAASELGIRTVAVFTYEDRYSLHRFKADEAYQIGDQKEPLKPYLDIEEIIRVAKQQKVNAIHPGYGFLSENVHFARRCREEKIIFVGPTPEVMEQLGDKVRSKDVARACGVPVIEDNRQTLNDSSTALKEASRIGYPVIFKASAGGGGRGMRVIKREDELEKAFHEARREAGNAFGDDTVFIEKFIDDPKHVEVQILGDNQGNIVHLYERDCSVQRRFQKLVEVAPAPNLKQVTRNKLHQYALSIARHVSYNNAGTVEFLVDPEENVYFIEVNPRIQVEHTVTEEITGIDIVRSQILIADGVSIHSESINIPTQEKIQCNGFAIQCRITTEDPQNDFKPDYGTIIAYRHAGGYGIRLDEGSSYQGVKVSPFFDSMLVKITAKGRSLKGARQRLHRALREFRIRGVKTNIMFLENVIMHPEFEKGSATVKFIEKYPDLLQFRTGQDRGTKMLRYLADVLVNGNPDVSKVDPDKIFQIPKVPAFERNKKITRGTKQLLDDLGPEKFTEWVKEQNQTLVTDTTFRDAHQSLLATRVRSTDMLKVAESFARHHPQLFSMEVWGGATFDVALRFLHECPWQRLQDLRSAIPNILLQMLIRGSNAVGYTSYPDNLVEKFIEKSWENGVDVFRIFDSLNWLENMKVSIKAVKERTGGIAEACICYTGDFMDPSRQKYSLQYYLDLAKRIEDEGAHILCIKDMAGLLKPYAAEILVSELKIALSIPVHLHTHDTSSTQNGTYLKAIESGVDIVDVALASMSGLTSQPNFNVLAEILKNTPYALNFDINSLNEFSDYWEDVREYYYPFESGLQAGTAEVYKHEIPGGQYSNLKPQAISLGLADRMSDIKKAYEDVNKLFGDIVKVTPSSKVVGDLAMMMVTQKLSKKDLFEKGDSISFPESVKSMFRGDLGQPHGGWPSELQKIILKDEQPYTEVPNAHLKPVDFDAEYELFQKKFDHYQGFLDFLSWKFYPKVFEEYYNFKKEFGEVGSLPTPAFFYGMKPNEEIMINIGKGKTILVRLLFISDKADEAGNRTVFFRLNGQTRLIEIRDKNAESKTRSNQKAQQPNEIGAPLQGRLSKIFVKVGELVKKNAPLFTIEAMKMETTITAPRDLKVKRVVLNESSMVENDDMILEGE
ncbi:MAG: pyruvate carboxylase [Bacteroidetes bacterium]|nr:MAG: pyruvate carboxylase [Bacteroidota bacterium]REK04936.1 MAG: pyruvate carboxylase [Bacteroidota bacterium]REK36560.1 MAG: pyruvate carboxylase [Bacteroidota bacterium]REK50926.1 MAG: pyruvate carboxylase [Bacteroidota bacterium]